MKINELGIGKSARIERYGTLNEFIERLQELGLTPGTLITLIRRAPFKGPLEIAYGHSRLALRPTESDLIFVTAI